MINKTTKQAVEAIRAAIKDIKYVADRAIDDIDQRARAAYDFQNAADETINAVDRRATEIIADLESRAEELETLSVVDNGIVYCVDSENFKDNELPWPEPISHYDSNGPRDHYPAVFSIASVSFLVVEAGAAGPDTGRNRYKVVCRECDDILHKATTSPPSYIQEHLKKVHDYHRKLTHVKEKNK